MSGRVFAFLGNARVGCVPCVALIGNVASLLGRSILLISPACCWQAWAAWVFVAPSVSRKTTRDFFDAVAAGAKVSWPMVLVERGQHGGGAGLPVVGWFLVGPTLPVLLAGAFEASVIFVTPSVSGTLTTPMFAAAAVDANVFMPMVLMERGQHGVGAGLSIVKWFSVGAFLLAVAETKASGGFVRRTQNSWGRFCGGWAAFVHWGDTGTRCGALVGFGVVFSVVLGMVLVVVGSVVWLLFLCLEFLVISELVIGRWSFEILLFFFYKNNSIRKVTCTHR